MLIQDQEVLYAAIYWDACTEGTKQAIGTCKQMGDKCLLNEVLVICWLVVLRVRFECSLQKI